MIAHCPVAVVRQTENAQWSANVQRNTTMVLYCAHKGEISTEPLCDNSVGSMLLFEAQAGALRTLRYRRHFDANPDVQVALCKVCGGEQETTEHIVLKCTQLTPRPTEGTTLPLALGFESTEDRRNDAVSVHSFDGSKEEAAAFLDLGLFIGINGCSLKTAENLAVAATIPRDRLLIETDCPWCEIRPTHAGAKLIRTSFPAKKKERFEPGFMVKGRNEPANLV
ncbi:hypothetical protein HPB52_024227 [Rhipicephalus sanguineus]|uniref:Deoxyribonuclease TATDN1 n=1 Tax=Rhipicephalus sanguineus TaxID=34632 RepID=A0A9D4TCJ2_RHISA|nr:hypothetical protein HPB52_024227 [Rhipicephalus sanguineus]